MPVIAISQINYIVVVISFFEVVKILNGEPFLEAIMKILFFMSIIITFFKFMNILSFIIFVYEISECFSWFFTHSGFNNQVLLAIDLNWCFEHHFSLFFSFSILVILVLFLALCPFFSTKYIHISWHRYSIFIVMSLIYAFSFMNTFMKYLYPYEQMEMLPPQAKKMFFKGLKRFIYDEINIKSYQSTGKKNLILVELESVEQQLLGRFNQLYPSSMPFLSNLSKYGTFVERPETQPYTTWSVASLFASQCNMPLLMNGKNIFNSARFHLLKDHRCIGDYLRPQGYKLHSYLCNVFIAYFKEQLQMHGWDSKDFKDHGFDRDYDMFQYIGDNVIPNLTQKVNQPFILHIANADTHPFPNYIVDDRCKKVLKKKYNKMLKSFNCLDYILKKFFKKVEKSGLLNNTEVIIYGDHVLMAKELKYANIIDPRYILFMLPYHNGMKKNVITKKTSIYDMAPTIMKLVGIQDYSPQFPFGESIFSSKVGIVPDNRHFRFIYDFFSDKMKWNEEVKCGDQKGFCKKT